MASTRTYLDYLDDKVDIAPANSQEELETAQLIESLMKEHGLETQLQEFDAPSSGELPHSLLYVLMFVGMLLVGVLGTPMQIVGLVFVLISFVLLLARYLGHDILGSTGHGARSQNVIGVHRATGPLVTKGNRPIVIVAHYDTPNESLLYGPGLAAWQPILKSFSPWSVAIVTVAALIQIIGLAPEPVRHVFWIIGILASIPIAILGAGQVHEHFAPCTNGASDNKSSVAAMLGVMDLVRPADDRAKKYVAGHPHAPQRRKEQEEQDLSDDVRGAAPQEGAQGSAGELDEDIPVEADGIASEGTEVPSEEPEATAGETIAAPNAVQDETYAAIDEPVGEAGDGGGIASAFAGFIGRIKNRTNQSKPHDAKNDVSALSDEIGFEEQEGSSEPEVANVSEEDGDIQTATSGAEGGTTDTTVLTREGGSDTGVTDVLPSQDTEAVGQDIKDRVPEVGETEPVVDNQQPFSGETSSSVEEKETPAQEEIESGDISAKPVAAENEVSVTGEADATADEAVTTVSRSSGESVSETEKPEAATTETEITEPSKGSAVDAAKDSTSEVSTADKQPQKVETAKQTGLERPSEETTASESAGETAQVEPHRVRRGAGLLESLHILPDTCEIVYELPSLDDESEEQEDKTATVPPFVTEDLAEERIQAGEPGASDFDGGFEPYEATETMSLGERIKSFFARRRRHKADEASWERQADNDLPDNGSDVLPGPVDIAPTYEASREDASGQPDTGADDSSFDVIKGNPMVSPMNEFEEEHEETEAHESLQPRGFQAYEEVLDAEYEVIDDALDNDLPATSSVDGEQKSAGDVDATADDEDVSEASESTDEVMDEETPPKQQAAQDTQRDEDKPAGAQDAGLEDTSVQDKHQTDETKRIAQAEPADKDEHSAASETLKLHFEPEEPEPTDEEVAVKDSSGLSTMADDGATLASLKPEEKPARPAEINDPNWGKSELVPQKMNVARRAVLFDLPDPASDEQDPLSTGSHDAIDPAGTAPRPVAGEVPEVISADDLAKDEDMQSEPDAAEDNDAGHASGRPHHHSSDHPEHARKDGRRHRHQGRKARKQEAAQDESSMTEWLGLEDDYDAKKDGRKIGSWDHFGDDEKHRGSWKGGATYRSDLEQGVSAGDGQRVDNGPEWQELHAEGLREAILGMGDDELVSHDIWFVALGASELGHAGMREFLAEHRKDIRGALLINLDSIGCGALTILTQEGSTNTRRADRRTVRLLKSVSQDLHIRLKTMRYDWSETDATQAMQARVRACTIMGVSKSGVAALSHTADDVYDNLKIGQVVATTDLIAEAIRRS